MFLRRTETCFQSWKIWIQRPRFLLSSTYQLTWTTCVEHIVWAVVTLKPLASSVCKASFQKHVSDFSRLQLRSTSNLISQHSHPKSQDPESWATADPTLNRRSPVHLFRVDMIWSPKSPTSYKHAVLSEWTAGQRDSNYVRIASLVRTD